MDNYKWGEKLGEGTYGEVYKAVHKESGRICAIKKIKRSECSEVEGLNPYPLREISILQRLDGLVHVIKVFEVFYDSEFDARTFKLNPLINIVCEYMDSDLRRFMSIHPKGLKTPTVRELLLQLCQGVAKCHSLGVIHRDLKPENVLLSQKKLKIADAGIARIFPESNEDCTPGMVTRSYRAPEILLGDDQYHAPIDMWSVGCIFAEMLTGKILFHIDDKNEDSPEEISMKQMHTITRTLGWPTDRWEGVTSLPKWETYKLWARNPRNTGASRSSSSRHLPSFSQNAVENDLLHSMLRYDPAKRISARGALVHRYLGKISSEHVKRS